MRVPCLQIYIYTTLSYYIAFYLVFMYNNFGDCMKPLKEKISITIDGDILTRARKEAEKDDRSLSQYINLLLKEHFKAADHTEGEAEA